MSTVQLALAHRVAADTIWAMRSEATTHRLNPWWKLVWALVALVFITVLMVFVWYNSRGDLAAVRAEAKEQGFPTSVEEWNRRLPPVSQQQAFERLGILINRIKTYDAEVVSRGSSAEKRLERLRPHWPVPQQARDLHAAYDPVVVDEALEILDALPWERVVLSDGDPKRRPRKQIGNYRQLTRWLGERVLLVADDHVIDEVRRLLHALVVIDASSDFDTLVESSLIALTLSSLEGRLPQVRPHAREISERLITIKNRLLDDLRAGLIGSFIEMLDALQRPRAADSMGLDCCNEQPWWGSFASPIRVRVGRAAALRTYLERDLQLKHLGLGSEYVRWSAGAKKNYGALRDWHPGEWLPKQTGSFYVMMDQTVALAGLHLNLLIAELRGELWPIDSFDPTGQPLRKLMHDGQAIGAYTVYENQLDDGGQPNRDRQFLLFGAWNPPEKTTNE